MKEYMELRVLETAEHLVRTGATVREAAKVFRVSKSTVHKDMMERLPEVDAVLAAEVRRVLEKNKAERHIRGGRATCIKYGHKKSKA